MNLAKVGYAHYIDIEKADKIDFTRLKFGEKGYNKEVVTFSSTVTFKKICHVYYGQAALNISNAYKKQINRRA